MTDYAKTIGAEGLANTLVCGVEYLRDVLDELPGDSSLRGHIEGYLEELYYEDGVREARFWYEPDATDMAEPLYMQKELDRWPA